MIQLQLHASFPTAIDPTPRVCQIASMFGLGVDESRSLTIVPPTTLSITPHQLIFITGASGGGKTTLLNLIRHALPTLHSQAARLIDFDTLLPNPQHHDAPIVEALGGSLEQAVRWLSIAGLNDAFIMLRRLSQLSDGQRYRYRLAHAIALTEAHPDQLCVVLADEFGSTLDRLTASVIARNIRKWTSRANVCFIAATTHDDLLEPLHPDTLIIQHPGQNLQLLTRATPACHEHP
jgi:ABC-type ATPase with predicted acetyltransferase domain